MVYLIWDKYPISDTLTPKVLGREFEGDSPRGGEVSPCDRGGRASANPFSKGFSSINHTKFRKSDSITPHLFYYTII